MGWEHPRTISASLGGGETDPQTGTRLGVSLYGSEPRKVAGGRAGRAHEWRFTCWKGEPCLGPKVERRPLPGNAPQAPSVGRIPHTWPRWETGPERERSDQDHASIPGLLSDSSQTPTSQEGRPGQAGNEKADSVRLQGVTRLIIPVGISASTF